MKNLVEVARSFSYKLNVGNYESRDFFCSQKAECAPEDAEKISEALYEFCKKEVIKAVNQYKKEVPKVQRATPTLQKYMWGNEEPPKWIKTDGQLKMWLVKQGLISSFNDPEVTQESHSSEEIAAEREIQNQEYA